MSSREHIRLSFPRLRIESGPRRPPPRARLDRLSQRAEPEGPMTTSLAKEVVSSAPRRATSSSVAGHFSWRRHAPVRGARQGCVARRRACPLVRKCTRLVPAMHPQFAIAGNTTCPFPGLFRSPLTDSNRRPPPYHGGALPTELRGRSRDSRRPARRPVASAHRFQPPATSMTWPVTYPAPGVTR